MGLYVQLHSMHGLFRSYDLELGRDEDTGGQIVYVLELAKALSELAEIDKIDIVTRRIIDVNYPGYSDQIEKVNDKLSIVRIECGPEQYIKKVNLWPYLKEFVDNTKKYIKKIGRKPDIFQSNYADSGLVCSKLSKDLKIAQVHTGHSLGIPKMKRLGTNGNHRKKLNKIYHFDKRIKAEKVAFCHTNAIVASTKEETREQYGPYNLDLDAKFNVIAPGVILERFDYKENKNDPHWVEMMNILDNIVDQNLKYPKRTLVTTLSRLDKRKNIVGLIEAFAMDKELQRIANLMIFAPTLEGDSKIQKLIKKMNKVIRENNLYENITMPALKLNYEKQVPAYYQFIAKNKGIFVNPALIEPFGLTVLEAGASGVPVVATKNGGPSEILTHEVNGMLIDPKDPKDIAKQIKKLIKNKELYKKAAKNIKKTVKREYSWKASAIKYLHVFKDVMKENDRLVC